MKTVAFFVNMPSPYRINFFNLLGQYCNLYVFFEMDKSRSRDNSWQSYNFKNFHPIFLKGVSYSGEAAFCPSIIKKYKIIKPDVNVVCNISSLTGLKLLRYFIKKKIDYIVEGDGGFEKKCSTIKRRIKEKIFKNAIKLLYTSDEHKKYLISYGADEEKLFHYPFSSIFESEIINEEDIDKTKNKAKANLGLSKFTFLSVGRFLDWKNFETTIEAFKSVDSKADLVIIGGSPTNSYINLIKQHNIKNIKFLPFMNKEELYKYMQASDCFVFSSTQDIWGLVINEAMANALPILSSTGTLSAVEMANQNNGIMLFESKDKERLSKLMNLVINMNDVERKDMIKNNLKKIHSYTLENMCKYHVDYLLSDSQK